MEVYVIKNNNGKYIKESIEEYYDGEDFFDYDKYEEVNYLYEATLYPENDLELITNMCKYQFDNCHPCKVKITEVEQNGKIFNRGF